MTDNTYKGSSEETPPKGSNVDTQTIHTGGDPKSKQGETHLHFDRSGNGGSVEPTPKFEGNGS